MGDEKGFDVEIRERMTRMETMLKVLTEACPGCQVSITALKVSLAEVSASARSAHHRLDSIRTDIGLLVTILGVVFTALNFFIHK